MCTAPLTINSRLHRILYCNFWTLLFLPGVFRPPPPNLVFITNTCSSYRIPESNISCRTLEYRLVMSCYSQPGGFRVELSLKRLICSFANRLVEILSLSPMPSNCDITECGLGKRDLLDFHYANLVAPHYAWGEGVISKRRMRLQLPSAWLSVCYFPHTYMLMVNLYIWYPKRLKL